jgi:hypothetical protein
VIGEVLTRVVQSAIGVPGQTLSFTLPFRATSAGGAPASPTVVEALGAGGWTTTLGRRAAADTVQVRAPFSGRLRVERRAGVETFVLDNATTAWLYRDLRRPAAFPDPLAPIPGTCAITRLDTAGFRPERAVRKEAARRGITQAQAAAQLLGRLRAPGGRHVEVSAGDVLGQVGDAGPVTLACALMDGSPVPLAWLFRELLRRAPKLLSPADRAHPFVTGSPPFRRDAFLDLVVLEGADQFDSLPRGAQQATVEARWPGAAAILPIAERNRRFVLPVPAQPPATVPVGVLVEGQRVPVIGAGGVGQAGTPAGTWELPVPSPGTAALTLGPAGPALVVRRPQPARFTAPTGSSRTWDGVLIPLAPTAAGGGGTAAFRLRIEGVSSRGSDVTATVDGQAAGVFPVMNSAFAGDVAVPAGGAHELVLTDGPATLTLGVLPVAVVLGAPRPAWWGSNDPNVLPKSAAWPPPTPEHYTLTRVDSAHPPATDEGPPEGWDRDALRLGARLVDNGALARELGAGAWTVAWKLTLHTAMPFAAGENDPPPQPVRPWPPPAVRWVTFDLIGQGGGVGFGVAWDPPPLVTDRTTAAIDNPPGMPVTDALWRTRFALQDAGTWAGGTAGAQGRTLAGPACGDARLVAEIRKDGVLVAGPPPTGGAPGAGPVPAEFRVVGYRWDDLPWAWFYQFLRGRVQARFGPAYPDRQRIGLDVDGLCGVLLAILAKESMFLHYDSLDQIWASTDRDRAGIDRAVWPRGPVTNAQPPAAVRVAGMPVTAQGADLGLGQIANRPTFGQYNDWRENLDRAVGILRDGFSPGRVREAEVLRLLKGVRAVAAGDEGAAREALRANVDPLAGFMAAVRGDATRLLQSFVKLYNGPGDYRDIVLDEGQYMPYRSTLTWDHATQAWTQPAGPAFNQHGGCDYIFRAQWGWAARYATVRAHFRSPDRVDGAAVATVGAMRQRLFNLPTS